jgi:hypothetical protein
MTQIVERTPGRLVVENKPRISFGIAVSLGVIAFFGSLYPLLFQGAGLSKDIIFGLVLGPIFAVGGLLLYRETITIFDKSSGMVIWKQRGLMVNKSDRAELKQIRNVVIGRPISDQSGGATRLTLILDDRSLPLMFGFSSANRDREISEAIKIFIKDS